MTTKRKWPTLFEEDTLFAAGPSHINIKFQKWLYQNLPEEILNKIAPKEPFRFEAEVEWCESNNNTLIYPKKIDSGTTYISHCLGKRGKLIFVEGEAE